MPDFPPISVTAPDWGQLRALHMSQQASAATPDAPVTLDHECGPTVALMAVRELGLDLPGFEGEHTQLAINAAREIATGSAVDGPTTADQLAKVAGPAGAEAQVSSGADDSLDFAAAAVRDGHPVILAGNETAPGTWFVRENPQLSGNMSGHFVLLSGYDAATGAYFVNDPMLDGPIEVPLLMLKLFHDGVKGESWAHNVVFSRKAPAAKH
jgi:hypothetical protein